MHRYSQLALLLKRGMLSSQKNLQKVMGSQDQDMFALEMSFIIVGLFFCGGHQKS